MLANDDKSISYSIQILKTVFDLMVNEAEHCNDVETGGLLFGQVGKQNQISVLKTIIPPTEFTSKQKYYFEIDPEYAKNTVRNEPLLYLGNWHKHLGYGGPSGGDTGEVEEFFENNPHLKLIMATILDYRSINDHELIIEVYERTINAFEPFKTYRVNPNNISIVDSIVLEQKEKKELGISKNKVERIKEELVIVYKDLITISDIHEFAGSIPGEKILSFPYYFNLNGISLNLLILISIPPEYPEGQIFIDISSKDLSRNFTFEKHPASVIDEEEVINPFLSLLKTTLEDEVPNMLKEPLWKIMQ